MSKEAYTCPMHPEIVSAKPGKCPKCGMKLVEISKVSHDSLKNDENLSGSYAPLYVVIGLILLVSIAV